MKLFRIQILFLFVVVLFACNSTVVFSEIPGTYKFELDDSISTLKIHSNGEYTYLYLNKKTGEKWENKNRWDFEGVKNDILRITFDSFTFYHKKKEKTGIWSAPIQKRFGEILVCFDRDVSINKGCFKKQK